MFGTVALNPRSRSNELTCVCCNCRRERSPSGEWGEHVPVAGEQLTHGICPACFVALYPEYAYLQQAG